MPEEKPYEPVKEEDIPSWSGWGPGGMGLPLEAYGDPLQSWDLEEDDDDYEDEEE